MVRDAHHVARREWSHGRSTRSCRSSASACAGAVCQRRSGGRGGDARRAAGKRVCQRRRIARRVRAEVSAEVHQTVRWERFRRRRRRARSARHRAIVNAAVAAPGERCRYRGEARRRGRAGTSGARRAPPLARAHLSSLCAAHLALVLGLRVQVGAEVARPLLRRPGGCAFRAAKVVADPARAIHEVKWRSGKRKSGKAVRRAIVSRGDDVRT